MYCRFINLVFFGLNTKNLQSALIRPLALHTFCCAKSFTDRQPTLIWFGRLYFPPLRFLSPECSCCISLAGCLAQYQAFDYHWITTTASKVLFKLRRAAKNKRKILLARHLKETHRFWLNRTSHLYTLVNPKESEVSIKSERFRSTPNQKL